MCSESWLQGQHSVGGDRMTGETLHTAQGRRLEEVGSRRGDRKLDEIQQRIAGFELQGPYSSGGDRKRLLL